MQRHEGFSSDLKGKNNLVNEKNSYAWWHEPLIPAVRVQRQEVAASLKSAGHFRGLPGLHRELYTSQGYKVRLGYYKTIDRIQ